MATDRFGIGYSGIGYRTSDVRVLPLAVDGTDYVVPSAETADDYPLSRFLFIAINYQPGGELDPLRREFLKYVFSKDGQQAVIKDGYLPITAALAAEELKKVGITK